MDLSGFEEFIPNIAAWLKLDPATVLFLFLVIKTGANVASRLIPDTSTGWLGYARKLASIIGIDVSKRVAPGVTVNEVAKVTAVKEGLAQPPVEEESPDWREAAPDPIDAYLEAVRGGEPDK